MDARVGPAFLRVIQVGLRLFQALEALALQRRLFGMANAGFDFTFSIWILSARQGDHAVVCQNIAIQWIQTGIVDVGDQNTFFQIVQNHDSRRSAQPPKGLLMQLGPGACARTGAQQPNRFAAVAQRQYEHPGAPVLAALRVAHHRAAAVINLRLFPGAVSIITRASGDRTPRSLRTKRFTLW